MTREEKGKPKSGGIEKSDNGMNMQSHLKTLLTVALI